jgi:hypothetical protein
MTNQAEAAPRIAAANHASGRLRSLARLPFAFCTVQLYDGIAALAVFFRGKPAALFFPLEDGAVSIRNQAA